MTYRNASPLLACLAALITWTVNVSPAHAQYYEPQYYQPRQPQQPQYQPHSRPVRLYPRGLYVGGGLVATRILSQDGGSELLEHGAGMTLYTGLRVNRSLSLELGWLGSLHNPVAVNTPFGTDTDYLVLNAFTADAKIHLGGAAPQSDMEPYLQAGLGVYLLDSDSFGTQSVGTGFQAGGGLDFRIRPHVLLGVRGLYRGLAMGPPDMNYNDTFVSAFTLEGNLQLRF